MSPLTLSRPIFLALVLLAGFTLLVFTFSEFASNRIENEWRVELEEAWMSLKWEAHRRKQEWNWAREVRRAKKKEKAFRPEEGPQPLEEHKWYYRDELRRHSHVQTGGFRVLVEWLYGGRDAMRRVSCPGPFRVGLGLDEGPLTLGRNSKELDARRWPWSRWSLVMPASTVRSGQEYLGRGFRPDSSLSLSTPQLPEGAEFPIPEKDCVPLESQNDQFSVWICPPILPWLGNREEGQNGRNRKGRHHRRERPCNSFSILVIRTSSSDCHIDPVGLIDSSNRPSFSLPRQSEFEFVRSQLGQDAFEVVIRGIEHLSIVNPIGYDPIRRPCQYLYPVEIRNGNDRENDWLWKGGLGGFEIQVYWMYSDFESFGGIYQKGEKVEFGGLDPFRASNAEGAEEKYHPRVIAEPVTPTKKSLPLLRTNSDNADGIKSWEVKKLLRWYGGSRKHSWVCSENSCPTWRFLSKENEVSEGIMRQVEQLPLCSLKNPVGGSLFPRQPGYDGSSSPTYRWQPLGCRWSHHVHLLLDTRSEPSSETMNLTKECFVKERKVVFIGGRNVQRLYEELVERRLRAERIEANDSIQVHKVGGTTFEFKWDPLGETLKLLSTTQADAYVVSTGSHQLASHWSTAKFTSQLIRIMRRWAKSFDVFGGKHASDETLPRKVIFASPLLLGDDSVDSSKDWRTNLRLLYWSQTVMNILSPPHLKLDLALVDGVAIMLPFFSRHKEWAHGEKNVIMEALLSEILHKLRLCPTWIDATLSRDPSRLNGFTPLLVSNFGE